MTILLGGCVQMDELRQQNEEKESEIRQLRAELNETKESLRQRQQSMQQSVNSLQTQQRGGAGFPGQPLFPAAAPTPTPTPSAVMPEAPLTGAPAGGVPPAPQFSATGEAASPSIPSAATPLAVQPVSSITTLRTDLETVFSNAVKQGQATVQQNGAQVTITIWSDIAFSQGAQVNPDVIPYLKAIGDLVARDPNLRTNVQAYSSAPSATQQSQAIAEAIKANSSLSQTPTFSGNASPAQGRERVEITIQ